MTQTDEFMPLAHNPDFPETNSEKKMCDLLDRQGKMCKNRFSIKN